MPDFVRWIIVILYYLLAYVMYRVFKIDKRVESKSKALRVIIRSLLAIILVAIGTWLMLALDSGYKIFPQ